MLDHVEKIFADMKPMMKKLKKASYKVNMEAFIENHGHYFREMTEYTENASDKETAAKELAVDFTDKVYDAYVSPKKGKIDSAIQTDLNFFMIYYVFLVRTDMHHLRIRNHLCCEYTVTVALLHRHQAVRCIQNRRRNPVELLLLILPCRSKVSL